MSTLNFRTLDLNLLRVFDEVMAERSLTRAARNLSLTQPAISNALRRLKDALGDELVQRDGQGIAPTPRALALWPTVREALQQLQTSLSPGRFEPTTATTSFVIAMADASAAELVPGLCAGLEQSPGVSLRVVPLTTRDPRKLLDAGTADLAAGYFPAVIADLSAREQSGEPASFHHERLFTSEYVCVMRPGHPLATGPLTVERYCEARHLLVSVSGRPYGFVDEALSALGQRRRIVMTVNQFFTAGRVVAGSDLLTVLPRHFISVTGLANHLVLRELPLQVAPVHIETVWPRRLHHDSAHQWLRALVADAARKAFAHGGQA